MWYIFGGLLITIAFLQYKVWRRTMESEVHSSKNWYMERLPFSSKLISRKTSNEKKMDLSRNKMSYDPEADYESLEVFYKK